MMARRRDLLRYGVATTLLPLAQRVAASPLATDSPASLVVRGIVFEPRFAAAEAMSRHATDHGLALFPIGTDMAAFWFDVLKPRLDQRTAIAGLTSRSALFCLLELARDANLRLRYSAEQPVDSALRTASWPASFVSLLTRDPDGLLDAPPPASRLAIAGTTDADTLHSWLIGPRAARCST